MITILLAFGEITHFEGGGGGGRLPKKGRYGCAASAKPTPQKTMPGQKSAQKPNDRASFHDLRVPNLKIFSKWVTFFTLY